MPTAPLNKKGTLKLTGIRGGVVEVRPAMLISMRDGDFTCLEMINGCKVFVKEPAAQILSLIAEGAGELLAGAAAYYRLAESLDCGYPTLQEIISGDDGKAARIEELTTAAYGKGRSTLSRLFGIYGELLSPFTFVKTLSSGDRGQAPTSLEREIATRCADAERKD